MVLAQHTGCCSQDFVTYITYAWQSYSVYCAICDIPSTVAWYILMATLPECLTLCDGMYSAFSWVPHPICCIAHYILLSWPLHTVHQAVRYTVHWSVICNLKPIVKIIVVRSMQRTTQHTDCSNQDYVMYNVRYILLTILCMLCCVVHNFYCCINILITTAFCALNCILHILDHYILITLLCINCWLLYYILHYILITYSWLKCSLS